ncbi:CMRF35-like molecule 9 isoform X1 [Ictalurus punctatus]|uniref:CMRF35-like molecule 9 isoform X1 n=1 Tax=Ictalurus punctatus TaxID=7998 RepID=A0A2D0QZE5_ICTPU|nr:CMRF35-like molecule 9 isoform X1 [Ictalurus punctatus]
MDKSLLPPAYCEEPEVISQTSSAASCYIVQLTAQKRQNMYISHCAEFSKKAGDVQKIMQRFLWTLSLFQVLICMTMKVKAESVFTGTEGGSVDISCKYPAGYQYTPMYFCRDPCSYSDVLIKSVKADTVASKERYTALNTLSARRFSVTIRHLTLKDSGVYYCGVDTWGKDKLTKVKLTVSEAVPTVSTRAPVTSQNQIPEVTESPCATTVITAAAESSTFYEQASSTPQTQHSLDLYGQLFVVCGGVLGLMLCCVLAALVILYRKKSTHITTLKPAAPAIQISHPPPGQENICHVYDEMLAVYTLAGPPVGDESSATYSTIQLPAPADNDCSP